MLQALALGGLTLPVTSLDGWLDVPGDVLHWASYAMLLAARGDDPVVRPASSSGTCGASAASISAA